MAKKSNLEIIKEVDTFPYPGTEEHTNLVSTLYTLIWHDGQTPRTISYIAEAVLNAFAKVPIKIKGELEVNRAKRTISAFTQATEAERSAAVAATCQYWRENHTFQVLTGWRDELYPIYGAKKELLYNMERSATPLFGVTTFGVHMTAYTKVEGASHGIKIWVPRRAKTKQTYPGMLDNTVAGGITTGESPFESLVREADEEASLPEELVRRESKAFDTVTYMHIREGRAGGETGLIQPECQYIYDLELPAEVKPKPNDAEVEEFYLWSVEEVQEALGKGEFKPNCALVMIDFFIRWGILTEENEKDYAEIKRRSHRSLEISESSEVGEF